MILAAGAVLVLGMAVYLLREVGKTPASAEADTVHAPPPVVADTPAQPRITTGSNVRRVDTNPNVRIATRTQPAEVAVSDPPTEAQPPEVAAIATFATPKLDAIMAEANRAYDHGDFDEAKQIAEKVLAKNPGNVRMLRILVSSECITGDAAIAQKYFNDLPVTDRAQMRTRCDRYGVTLRDP